ncbi:MAG: hypothetical protein JRI94_14310 [Deltaproteobacteria bacterium]|nr:hypothetical protein [Deltaproteobacteria bacterium]
MKDQRTYKIIGAALEVHKEQKETLYPFPPKVVDPPFLWRVYPPSVWRTVLGKLAQAIQQANIAK